jgi:hypothetical protein
MEDKDGVIFVLELLQLLGHRLRGKMARKSRQLLLFIGEGTFYENSQQIPQGIRDLPDMFCRPCISRIDDMTMITSYDITDRRYAMVNLLSPDAYPLRQRIEYTLLDRLKAEDMTIPGGDGGKIWTDNPIDEVPFNRFQYCRRTANLYRPSFFLQEVVGQKKDILYMIEMGMGDVYALNPSLLF